MNEHVWYCENADQFITVDQWQHEVWVDASTKKYAFTSLVYLGDL